MQKKEKSKQGGKRAGSGRKKSDILKIPITLYISIDKINKFGDKKAFMSEFYKLIENNL